MHVLSSSGMTKDERAAHLAEHNPVDCLAPLAKAKIPLFHIHGDMDQVVPLEANSGLVATSACDNPSSLRRPLTLAAKILSNSVGCVKRTDNRQLPGLTVRAASLGLLRSPVHDLIQAFEGLCKVLGHFSNFFAHFNGTRNILTVARYSASHLHWRNNAGVD